jgi:hypothetical protein
MPGTAEANRGSSVDEEDEAETPWCSWKAWRPAGVAKAPLRMGMGLERVTSLDALDMKVRENSLVEIKRVLTSADEQTSQGHRCPVLHGKTAGGRLHVLFVSLSRSNL